MSSESVLACNATTFPEVCQADVSRKAVFQWTLGGPAGVVSGCTVATARDLDLPIQLPRRLRSTVSRQTPRASRFADRIPKWTWAHPSSRLLGRKTFECLGKNQRRKNQLSGRRKTGVAARRWCKAPDHSQGVRGERPLHLWAAGRRPPRSPAGLPGCERRWLDELGWLLWSRFSGDGLLLMDRISTAHFQARQFPATGCLGRFDPQLRCKSWPAEQAVNARSLACFWAVPFFQRSVHNF